MAKQKSIFICQNCGYQSPAWIGKCPDCGNWNTFAEEVVASSKSPARSKGNSTVVPYNEVEENYISKVSTGIDELDKVLGGHMITGSAVLLGGEPGIGKSTLGLQLAKNLSLDNTVLYVSGEESIKQIQDRLERILDTQLKLKLYMASENNLSNIFSAINESKPAFIILDSIQSIYDDTITSVQGSLTQVRECASKLIQYCKSNNITILLIGHITKDGQIAGPKVLEHMVDVVLYIEGERNQDLRSLRVFKNRFGTTNVLGLFEMRENGLIGYQDKAFNLNEENIHSGSVIALAYEGERIWVSEVQALVTQANYGTPRRVVNGYDYNRVLQVIAVLEKHLRLSFSKEDVYLNITGGLRINDTGCDLPIACALVSSLLDKAVPHNIAFVGEVGLSGEIREVSAMEKRIAEGKKLGIKKFVAKHKLSQNLISCDTINAAVKIITG